jgi:hypothetical protein
MNLTSRFILILTLLVIAAIGFMPPRQALDYDDKYVQADGTLAPRPIAVARSGIFSDRIYKYNYHKGGGAYIDIPASIDTARLIAEVFLVSALGGILLVVASSAWQKTNPRQ